ncbi:hypothetical protein [Bacillus manliponensis]|uniref:hypothetical protein n=1 Tax=Bacillus manliponensis TaxID=574376 RepID=UPI0035165C29
MCSNGQFLFLPRAALQQMDEGSTLSVLIYVTATLVLNPQVGYICYNVFVKSCIDGSGIIWET